LTLEGVSSSVLDLRSLVPLDVEGLIAAFSPSGKAVVVHEAPQTGGFGAEIAATLQREAFNSMDAPIQIVASRDSPYPPGALEDYFLPSVARVLAAARTVLAY
jgi:pyruvate dehydrogenase E1 component beta subunit